MKKFAWLLAGALFPIAAMAADAPGPDWAFMTPDPNAPAPQPPAAGAGGGGAPAAPAAQPGVPQIVVAGKGADVRPCNTCHTPSGMGQPESANIRGLNADYFARQMQDFKSGARGGPRSAAMSMFAKGMTDDEIKEVAAYYSSLKPVQWTRVSESNVAPKTIVGRNSQRTRVEGTDTEQVGNRIIEFANSPAAVRQMADPAFIAFVPPGALGNGRTIVTTGGGGKAQACSGCHGDKLQGADDVPGIAGRSPVYLARQIYSFKNGVRKGPMAEIMKSVVGKLSDDDVIGVASYVSTLDPS
ncbi:MAG TPA: c-type cytochrome [Micropepsaceae bacterium]|nr:c-type cytochrome [Micropepsaceae bacterium]